MYIIIYIYIWMSVWCVWKWGSTLRWPFKWFVSPVVGKIQSKINNDHPKWLDIIVYHYFFCLLVVSSDGWHCLSRLSCSSARISSLIETMKTAGSLPESLLETQRSFHHGHHGIHAVPVGMLCKARTKFRRIAMKNKSFKGPEKNFLIRFSFIRNIDN